MLTTKKVLGVSSLTAKTSDGTTSSPIESSLIKKSNQIFLSLMYKTYNSLLRFSDRNTWTFSN